MKLASKLQSKKSNTDASGRPIPFVLKKDRRLGLIVASPKIDWDNFTEEECASQWAHCKQIMWEDEKEGVISRADVEPAFYAYLVKIGYSKNDISNIKKLKSYSVPYSLISSAFLLSLGYKNVGSDNFVKNMVSDLIKRGTDIAAIDDKPAIVEKPKRNIQDAMADQLSDIIGELQGFEDELKPDVYKWLQSTNVPKVHADAIRDYFQPRLDELHELIEGKDDQLNEAYSSYKKKEIKTMISWYEQLMVDLDAYKRLKLSLRKVRVRKPKSPAQLVKSLNYLAYSEDYKIQSIKPESIIGASVLWLMNVKTRKLIVYNATEMEKDLTVKGSTILGWDPKTSFGKTLRKPEEQLKDFLVGGKVAMRNYHKAIKGKDAKLNGRINKDMVLLKVY